MVGADAGQQMLLALLDAGVEFIVVGGTRENPTRIGLASIDPG